VVAEARQDPPQPIPTDPDTRLRPGIGSYRSKATRTPLGTRYRNPAAEIVEQLPELVAATATPGPDHHFMDTGQLKGQVIFQDVLAVGAVDVRPDVHAVGHQAVLLLVSKAGVLDERDFLG